MQHFKNFILLFILLFTNAAYSMEADDDDVQHSSTTTSSSSPVETDNYEYVNDLKKRAIKKCEEIEQNLRAILQDVTITKGHSSFVHETDDTNNKEMLIAQVRGRFANPEEFLQQHIVQRKTKKYIDMMSVINLCENDRYLFPLKANIPGSDYITREFEVALDNGHVIKKEESPRQEFSFKEGEFSFNEPSTKQTVLVLGCGHQSNVCPNHMRNRNPTHYTVDINRSIKPDAISHFYDKRLWENLRKYAFKEVILEGVSVIKDSLLMRSIFDILVPDGIVKTLHDHPSLLERDGQYTPEAFLYKSTMPLIDEPLLTITYREHLEKIGFIETASKMELAV